MVTFIKENWIDNSDEQDQTNLVAEVPGATVFGVQASVTGSPGGCAVRLRGSLDGIDWFDLVYLEPTLGPTLVWSEDRKPVKYIRIATTLLVGGTDPAVTASVIAV